MQTPPVEGPLKKNLSKSESTPPTPKAKPQAASKGQQQITSLLKVQQPKQETPEPKPSPAKTVATPVVQTNKKPVKETKKPVQQPPAKKTPTLAKKAVKEEPKVEPKKEEGRGKDFEEQKVRTSVKQILQEVLTTRLQETADLKRPEEEVLLLSFKNQWSYFNQQ